MAPTLSAQDFVAKWRRADLSERSAVQQHFLDLCALVGHPPPAEYDPTGREFAFEMGAEKTSGGTGWADVAKIGFFGWEYKGKHADLDKAYQQLLQYRESLQNPPLLVVSDTERIIIHTNFTNTPKRVEELTLDDLLTVPGREKLSAIFFEPGYFQPGQTTEDVTKAAAAEFAKLAESLHRHGAEPQKAAHFLIRLLFVLFAEDIELLPAGILKKLVDQTRRKPKEFSTRLRQLYGVMVTGGYFGEHSIPYYNGGLFDDDTVFDLDSDALDILAGVDQLDWSSIEPSIFGTLFARSLEPSKRAQLGAQYTSEEDILLIVEPVLMAPLRRKWADVQAQARELAAKRDAAAKGRVRDNIQGQIKSLLMGFADEIAQVRVLDPACGSGNFLYVSLRLLLDLQKEVRTLAAKLGVGAFFPTVSPAQMHGIEYNEYAFELAQATIWIGYIQWLRENGFGTPSEPILKPLVTIQHMDAIMAYDVEGKPVEPAWPETDVIVGNPPFLGDKKMRTELKDDYVEALRRLYAGRVPGGADLVCYWFERAREQIQMGRLKRAGLLATQGIRGGANREVLNRIKETGDIFWAQSDREWVLEGALVHVSMVGFDNGIEASKQLDGRVVDTIHSNLTATADTTKARILRADRSLSFLGSCKGGAFDITDDEAIALLHRVGNPNGRPNGDVIRPVFNGQDLLKGLSRRWIIDNADLELEQACLYEGPHQIVVQRVKPARDTNRDRWLRQNWWRPQRMRPEMRQRIEPLPRFIVTTTTSKHRVFLWLVPPALPDHQLVVFARSDEYFFGVLHSRIHEIWARAVGTQLRERESGFRYTPTSCFETFPFPEVSGTNETAVAAEALELNTQRDRWLYPPEWLREETLEFTGAIDGILAGLRQ